jgi:hypothetical protein
MLGPLDRLVGARWRSRSGAASAVKNRVRTLPSGRRPGGVARGIRGVDKRGCCTRCAPSKSDELTPLAAAGRRESTPPAPGRRGEGHGLPGVYFRVGCRCRETLPATAISQVHGRGDGMVERRPGRRGRSLFLPTDGREQGPGERGGSDPNLPIAGGRRGSACARRSGHRRPAAGG